MKKNRNGKKYFTSFDYNKFTNNILGAKIKGKKLVNESDIANFVKNTNSDDKLKNINVKVTSNRTKHVESENKLNELLEKVNLLSTKGYNFFLGRTYFTGHNGCQNFLVFTPMYNSLILDNNKKVTNWISTGVSTEKIKPFDVNLALIMT